MFRKVVCLIIVLSFLFVTGMVSSGWAGSGQDTEKKFKPSDAPMTTKYPYPINCPSGWKHKPGNPYACVPAKPAPIKCPEEPGKTYKYYESLTCTSIGGSCTGCEIGCALEPQIPR